MGNYLILEAGEFFKAYPFAVNELKIWMKKQALIGIDPEYVEAYTEQLNQAIDDEYVKQVLTYTPRLLYDFFDHYQIFCTPYLSINSWKYYITDSNKIQSEHLTAASRHEAEKAVFVFAFNTLEAQIKAAHTMTLKDVKNDIPSNDNGVRDSERDN